MKRVSARRLILAAYLTTVIAGWPAGCQCPKNGISCNPGTTGTSSTAYNPPQGQNCFFFRLQQTDGTYCTAVVLCQVKLTRDQAATMAQSECTNCTLTEISSDDYAAGGGCPPPQ